MELETVDFGPCCSCGREGDDLNVRNIVMLEQKGTVPGSGWGCVQCGLPCDGAAAVLCDDCMSLGRPIKFAIAGPAKDKKRVPIESLGAEHKHDMSKHPEVE
jgi:hypothetical protein